MRILAIETTGPICSVALLDEYGRISELHGVERMNHLKSLTRMIQQLLFGAEMTFEDIDRIAVSVGPGSFTGIRIGVSTARSLSQMTGIPLMAVPTLYAFGSGHCSEEAKTRLVCPTFDARRSQVYAGVYREREEVIPGGPYMLDEFLELIAQEQSKLDVPAELLFVGDGMKPYSERIIEWADAHAYGVVIDSVTQRATDVADFALDMLMRNEFKEVCELSYHQLEPNYMRKPEAERNLEMKKTREQQSQEDKEKARLKKLQEQGK